MSGKNISTKQVMVVTVFLVACAMVGFLLLKAKRTGSVGDDLAPAQAFTRIMLKGIDNKPLDPRVFSQGVYLFLFFKDDCISCATNLLVWRNVVDFYGKRIHPIGVLPGGNLSSLQSQIKKGLNFPLYFIADGHAVLQQAGINFYAENTIILQDNTIVAIYPGFLKGEGLNRLMASLEKCINQKGKKSQ